MYLATQVDKSDLQVYPYFWQTYADLARYKIIKALDHQLQLVVSLVSLLFIYVIDPYSCLNFKFFYYSICVYINIYTTLILKIKEKGKQIYLISHTQVCDIKISLIYSH